MRLRPPLLVLALALLPAGAVGRDWGSAPVGLAGHTASPAPILAAAERIGELEGVYSLLVVHRGELVLERYFREGTRHKPHNLKSASKSVVSALIGIAAAEGLVDLDRPLADYLPQAARLGDRRKAAITVRHLLTMTAGLEATSYDIYNEWIGSSDWVRAALELPLVAEPGTLFQYSSGNTHLLSAVLAAATGMSTRAFAEDRLFGPMAIEIRGWERDPQGIHIGGNNLSLTPRDMARFGQLYLDRGRWGGRQVVPAGWVAESTRTGRLGLHEIYGTYGYLWWTDLVIEGAFVAVGFGGQYIYVAPPHDCVVVVTSTLESKGVEWTARLFDLLRNEILPAFEPSARYFAERGSPPVDPALDSLERAVDRARIQIAALKLREPAAAGTQPARGRTTRRVHLRQGPATSRPSLGVVERGAALEILERRDGWLMARIGGREGWVHPDYVALEEPSWRGPAVALRRDLARFSEAADDRLPEVSNASAEDSRGSGLVSAVLVDELSSARRRIAALEASLAELRSSEAEPSSSARLEELEQALAEARIEREGLEARLAALQSSSEAERSSTARLQELEQALARARTEREGLEARLAALQSSEAERSSAGGEAMAVLTAARGRIEALERELAGGREERESLRRAQAELVETVSSQRDELARLARAGEAPSGEESASADRLEELERALAQERGQRESLEARLAALQSSEAERSSAGGEAMAALTAARGRIEALERELSGWREERETLRRAQAELAATVSSQRDELSRLTRAGEAPSGEESASSARLEELEQALARAQTEREGLEARLAALQSSEAERSSAGGEAMAALTAARGRIEALERELAGGREERESLRRAQAELVETVSSQRDELGRLARAGEAASGEESASSARLEELERALAQERGERESLEARLAALQSEAERSSAARLEELEQALTEAQTEREGLEARLAELRSSEAERSSADRLEELEKALLQARTEREGLEARLAALQSSEAERSSAGGEAMAALTAARGRIEALERELSGWRSERETLRQAQAELAATVSSQRDELGRLARAGEAASGEETSSSARLEELERALAQERGERESLEARLAALQSEAERSSSARLEELEQALTEAKTEREGLEARLAALRSSEAERSSAGGEAMAALAAARGRIEALERELSGWREERESLRQAQAELVATVSSQREELSRLARAGEAASGGETSSSARLEELERALAQERGEREGLEGRLAELQSSEDERLERLARQSSASQRRIAQLEAELASSTEAASLLEGRMEQLQRQVAEAGAPGPESRQAAVAAGAAAAPAQGPAADELSAVVRAWADSWSSGDLDGLLSFYASSFRPDRGQDRALWEAELPARLTDSGAVRLDPDSVELGEISDGRAWVRFRLLDSSDGLRPASWKMLILVREDGVWKIERESAAG